MNESERLSDAVLDLGVHAAASILEYAQQARDGFITASELARKIEATLATEFETTIA
jgi:hypothetical protein